jgi:hypothetical protein
MAIDYENFDWRKAVEENLCYAGVLCHRIFCGLPLGSSA